MVPPSSQRVPRARWYSGYRSLTSGFVYVTLTLSGRLSHTVWLPYVMLIPVRTPPVFLPEVWPLPISLATTLGISFDFSSSGYLDVSLPRVPLAYLLIQYAIRSSSPRGLPHSEICGWAYLQLTAAYRSLSRPSSAPDAKAFTLCSY